MPTHSTLQIRQILHSIGFSDNETKIICYLFHKRKATVRQISKETAISFSSVQAALSHLVTRHLVRCLPENEDQFEVCSEEDFITWIGQQKALNQNHYDHAINTMRTFLTEVREASWKPEVMYYEGKEEVIQLYEDMLNTAEKADKQIYSWIDLEKVNKVFGDYMHEYIKRRSEKNITSNDILPRNEVNLRHKEKREMRNMKFMDGLDIEGQVRVYGDKVAIIAFEGDKPVGFVFQGKMMVSLFKSIFESVWEKID